MWGGGGGGWRWHGAKHKPVLEAIMTRQLNRTKKHAEMTEDVIHPVEIKEHGMSSRHKRLFLGSLHSTLNTHSVNEPKPFPKVHLPFIVSLRDREKF